MSLLTLILVLVIIGVIMYFINAYVPMDGNIKKVLNAAVVIFLVIWLIQAFVPIADIRIGR